MKLSIDVDTKKLMQDITDDLVDEEGLIKELTLRGEVECKKEAPKDTGDLMRSITADLSQGVVKTDLEYAKYVILGTSAHTITIKKKKVLSDINSGSTKKKNAIYGTSVRHPGTKANAFHARALNQIKGELPAIVKKYIKVRGK
jgi:hypothetical protein